MFEKANLQIRYIEPLRLSNGWQQIGSLNFNEKKFLAAKPELPALANYIQAQYLFMKTAVKIA